MNVESFPSLLSLDILTALFQNVVLMLAFAFVYTILHPHIMRLGQSGPFLTGALLGLCAILLTTLNIVDGVFIDCRTLLFITAGAMSGRRSALAAVLVFAPYRLGEGGLGVFPSIISTLAAAGLGVVIYQRYGRLKPYYNLRDFLLMGVIAALCRLLASFALPWDLALRVLFQSAAAVLVIYPVTMVLVGTLFTREIRRVD